MRDRHGRRGVAGNRRRDPQDVPRPRGRPRRKSSTIIKEKLKTLLAQPTAPIRFADSRPDGHHGRRGERLRQDHLHRQADADVLERRQEGGPRRRRHLPRRGRRATDHLGRPLGRGDRHRARRAAIRPASPIARSPRPSKRGGRVHRRYRRPPANAAGPDAAAHQDPPRAGQADSRAPRTRCCWCSTPPPARTASARPSTSPRRSIAPASCWPSSTARPKAGVVVAIRKQVGLPVKYVGVGEKADDLALFEPDSFVDALFADLAGN